MNTKTQQHTPTPWKLNTTETSIVGSDGNYVNLQEQLPLIVRAVNSHEALLGAAKLVSDGINTAVDNDEHWNRQQLRNHLFALQSIVEKALAQAEKNS